MSLIPDKPALEGLEPKWREAWEHEGTYRFDRDAALAAADAQVKGAGRDPVFALERMIGVIASRGAG